MNDLTAHKCLKCGDYTISRRDGLRCIKCNGVLSPMGNAHIDKNKYLSIDVNMKDTDKFKEILGVIKDIIMDERIPREIREEIKEKFLSIAE